MQPEVGCCKHHMGTHLCMGHASLHACWKASSRQILGSELSFQLGRLLAYSLSFVLGLERKRCDPTFCLALSILVVHDLQEPQVIH